MRATVTGDGFANAARFTRTRVSVIPTRPPPPSPVKYGRRYARRFGNGSGCKPNNARLAKYAADEMVSAGRNVIQSAVTDNDGVREIDAVLEKKEKKKEN